MTKSQSNQAFNTGAGQQATSSGNAQSSYTAAQGDINNYEGDLASYQAKNPYVQGGQFQTSTNQQMADTAAAGSKATQQALTSEMVRSGMNPSAAIAAGEQVAENNAKTQMGDEASANEARLSGLTNYNDSVLKASAVPEQMEQGLMTPQLNAEEGALGNETSASKTPSFWQELGQGAINAGSSFAGAMCPAEGSLYLMADLTLKLVEDLYPGQKVLGIDGEPQTIEEIESAVFPIVEVTTESGHTLRCSRIHAFALPFGGFVEAFRATGKRVLVGGTGPGRTSSPVVSVKDAGTARVFNVVTDGSHTYRSNGIWSLGVGEAERDVTMSQWKSVAEKVSAPREVEVF